MKGGAGERLTESSRDEETVDWITPRVCYVSSLTSLQLQPQTLRLTSTDSPQLPSKR